MDAFTLVLAAIGSVLGVINLWREIDRSRVKLRVVPNGWIDNHGGHGLCIEVINRSEYAVTLVSTGIALSGDEKQEWHFMPFDSTSCPYRLEPHDAVTFRARPGVEKDDKLRQRGRHAFVRTACGVVATGNSAYLRSILAGAK